MEALDLRLAPPRSPRAQAAGIVFLPRSIDKLRASLPGGHLGAYKIDGHTGRLFEAFGTTFERALDMVRRATSDDDVAAEFLRSARPQAVADWNAAIAARLPRDGDRAAAIASYPWLAERPDIILSLDVLEEDDRLSFER